MERPRDPYFRLFPFLYLVYLAALAVIVASCAGASLSNMWKDPTFNTPLHNIFVVALKEDPSNRRLWEDELVKELSQAGSTATPSYRMFPNAVPDTQEVVQAVQHDRYDGVLIVFSHEPEATDTYVSGYVTTEPVTRVDPWSRRWTTYYVQVEHPGYYETNTILRDQVDLWSTGSGGRLVWTGTGEVVNPASSHDLRDAVADRIVPEMAKAGVIASD